MEDIFEEILTDSDEENINIIERPRAPKKFQRRRNHLQIWNEKEFLDRFRISKNTTRYLLNEIHDLIAFPTDRNGAVSAIDQLLIALRFYACGNMLITVGDFGGVHKSTAQRIITRVSTAIASLAPRYINFPNNEDSLLELKSQFYEIARFPKVLGAVDCTHIRIQSPGGDIAENFRNRKGYFSLNVQTIVDSKLKIRNIVARWPGATHDSTIFNNSRIKAELEDGLYGDCFLIGDSGYAIQPYLMTPLQNPVTRSENLYNEAHIRTRNVVERSYGVWKRRFPVLHFGIRLKMETIQAVIVATAVLHNIAMNMNDDDPETQDGYEDEELDCNINMLHQQGNGNLIRQMLINNYFSNL